MRLNVPNKLGFIMSRFVTALIFSALLIPTAQAFDLKNEVGLELTAFSDDGAQQQTQTNSSIHLQTEIHQLLTKNQQLDARVFARWDQQDKQRTHIDVREALWLHNQGTLQWRIGMGQVFWGVTEGAHLVDIINQTDAIESLDGDVKLGQAMVSLSWEHDAHLVDVYLLPFSRERVFASQKGRLRLPLLVDMDNASYESGAKNHHLDAAIRYQFNDKGLRAGLSIFSGTAREPELIPHIDPSQIVFTGFVPTAFIGNYQPTLRPYYPLIQQVGLDAQYIVGDWLWKVEAVHRQGMTQDYTATDMGVEYTQVGAFGSTIDVGWLAEYVADSRNSQATTAFEHDVLLGWRVAFNDAASSELLAGVVSDIHHHEQAWRLKGSSRLNDRLKLAIEARVFISQDPPSALQLLTNNHSEYKLSALANDSFVRTDIIWFF
jgi:hypothetical protein